MTPMANLSSAFGTFDFDEGFDLRQKQNFANLMYMTRDWHYSTNLFIHDDEGTVYEDDESLSFEATGRWTYNSSLEMMHNSLTGELDEEQLADYHELLAYMNEYDKSIYVDYADEESGCEVLYKERGVLNPYYSEDYSSLVLGYQPIETTNYDYTRTNLRKLDFYEDGFEVEKENIIDELEERAYSLNSDFLAQIEPFLESKPFGELEDITDELLEQFKDMITYTAKDLRPLYKADGNIYFKIINKEKHDNILDINGGSYNLIIEIDPIHDEVHEICPDQTSGFKLMATHETSNFDIEGIFEVHRNAKIPDYTKELEAYLESWDEYAFINPEFERRYEIESDQVNEKFTSKDLLPLYRVEDSVYCKIINEEKHDRILDCHGNPYNTVIEIDMEHHNVYEICTEQSSGFKILTTAELNDFDIDEIIEAHQNAKVPDYTEELCAYHESWDQNAFVNPEFIRRYEIGIDRTNEWIEVQEDFIPEHECEEKIENATELELD